MFSRQLLFKEDCYIALAQNEEKSKCSSWGVSIVLASLSSLAIYM